MLPSAMSRKMDHALLYGDVAAAIALLAAGEPPDGLASLAGTGCTALHIAAAMGSAELTSALLAAGADPNAADTDTETVLMWAAGLGHGHTVEMLLAAGARHDAVTDLDGTALRWAVKSGDAPTVRVLLRSGADPHAPGVMSAAEYAGNAEIIAMIREATAAV